MAAKSEIKERIEEEKGRKRERSEEEERVVKLAIRGGTWLC